VFNTFNFLKIIHSIYFLLCSLPSNIYRFQVSTNKNHKMRQLKLEYRCINFQNKKWYILKRLNRSLLQHFIWAKYLLLLVDKGLQIYTHKTQAHDIYLQMHHKNSHNLIIAHKLCLFIENPLLCDYSFIPAERKQRPSLAANPKYESCFHMVPMHVINISSDEIL